LSVSFLEELFSLKGKVAVVTGASRGIGACLATALGRAGAHVIGVARSARAPGQDFAYRRLDVTNGAAFRRFCAEVSRQRGRLDVLVHAAGISVPESPDRAEAFSRTIDVNLKAAYGCALAASEEMKKSGGGSIIHVTSINSVRGFPGNPGYVASKGGLRMLTQALAVDLGPHNIRVNNLAPGYIRTAMTEASFADPERYEQRRRHVVLGRWGEPQDLVGAALFLASDASAYVTGQDLFVDGGWTVKGLV
jgi:NAD(P)-dependent dehydrogenase (short-subunit alcohol dehydrogenase family)